MSNLNDRLDRELRRVLLASAAIILLSALVIYGLLSRLIIGPMERVVQALRGFSQGDREVRATVRSRDEVGLLANVFNEMADTIQTHEAEADKFCKDLKEADNARRQLLARLTTAREEERRRLSREIHDDMGQLLTGLSLYLKLCRQSIPDDLAIAHEHLVKANDLVKSTIDQSHRLVADLRPAALDDYGLAAALQEELDRRLASRGIAASLEIEGDLEELPAEAATAAFRILQEAVTNVIRHAHAHQVRIRVRLSGNTLEAVAEDDGTGLPDNGDAKAPSPDTLGLGIVGMRERAAAMGGCLTVSERQPCGTLVAFSLPLERVTL